MAKKKASAKKGKKKSKPEMTLAQRVRGSIRRFFVATFIIAGVLYACAYAVSRTEGFRSFVEDELEEALGGPVAIDDLRADWQLDLSVRGLRSGTPDEPGQAGLLVRRAKVDWSLLKWIRGDALPLTALEADGVEIAFAPAKNGWAPAAFGDLALWLGRKMNLRTPGAHLPDETPPEAAAQARVMAAWGQVRLTVTDLNARWWSGRGRELARLKQVELLATPVTVPGRNMMHYFLSIDRLRAGAVSSTREVQLELLRSGGEMFVLGFHSSRGGEAEPEPAETARPPRKRLMAPLRPKAVPSEPAPELPALTESPPPAPLPPTMAPSREAEEEFTTYIHDLLEGAVGK